MSIKAFQSQKALQSVAPLSTLTEHNGTIYLSGVTAIDPSTGVLEGDIEAQAFKSLNILRDILEDYGSAMENVLKVNLYLNDMEDFNKVNGIYTQFFSAPYPARTCVQAAKLPMGALIEIEVIAAKE